MCVCPPWQDVLQPGIECAVAWLLEQSHIGMADLWLYARVLEDGIDAILTRSRKEAQLARLRTDAARLGELALALSAATQAARVSCDFGTAPQLAGSPSAMAGRSGGTTDDDSDAIMVRVACSYSRGNAHVDTGNLQLAAGVYALAGPNGSGKSTLLSILSSCARGGALQPGISLDGGCAASLPSAGGGVAELVEVTQRQWCPLHSAPIRWVARSLPGEPSSHAEAAAALLLALRFDSSSDVAALAEQLTQEHEDYCGGLSGGQRAKLELVRAVFLRPACPALLLLDEVTTLWHNHLRSLYQNDDDSLLLHTCVPRTLLPPRMLSTLPTSPARLAGLRATRPFLQSAGDATPALFLRRLRRLGCLPSGLH